VLRTLCVALDKISDAFNTSLNLAKTQVIGEQ
jgi:hypothetical protein